MINMLSPSAEQQRLEAFTNTAAKLGIRSDMVEKDFWVYVALHKIFKNEELSKILCFKGGTSLSKVFKLIERFSEDVDLILSQEVILQTGEKLEQDSNSKQARFNETIETRAEEFITTELKSKIGQALEGLMNVYTDDDYSDIEPNYHPNKFDKHLLHIVYPKAITDKYLLPAIKLEIGPLALWNPNERYPLSSYVADAYANIGLEPATVPTVKPERTFWEKITILHHEHYRPTTSTMPLRYARHYYDVFKLGNSPVKEVALANTRLLEEVVEFKQRFYPRVWAKYDEAVPGTIRLYPAEHNLKELEKDYTEMQKMIFGNAPKWNDILEYLKTLEKEINGEF